VPAEFLIGVLDVESTFFQAPEGTSEERIGVMNTARDCFCRQLGSRRVPVVIFLMVEPTGTCDWVRM
jgi:hypothetical protein